MIAININLNAGLLICTTYIIMYFYLLVTYVCFFLLLCDK